MGERRVLEPKDFPRGRGLESFSIYQTPGWESFMKSAEVVHVKDQFKVFFGEFKERWIHLPFGR